MLVGASGLGYGVSLVVAFLAYILAQVFVVDLMAVFALDCGTGLFGELHLSLALNLYSLVSHAECFKKVAFAHFVHLALHHHDVFVGCSYHELDVSTLALVECGVDDEFAVHACHTHFRYRAVEGDIADSHGS